jgi:ABC-type transport system substrate-binding protein
MKRFEWQWLAISSLLLVVAAVAEVRPRYGGTLHVQMRAAPVSFDPMQLAGADSASATSLSSLLFDTLVTIDDSGRVQPALAESWLSTRENQVWEFRLRHGVKFSDGTALTAEIAAASLRVSNPSWKISAQGDTLVLEDVGDSELLAILALARNAITKRDQELVGTGPFHVAAWQPGKMLTLVASEDCWRGRPFLDGIEVEMGKNSRDQMNAFNLRKIDLAEIAPEQVHRAAQEGQGLSSSARMELLALVFAKDASSAEERQLRQALASSVERGSIRNVLLQGAGEPAGGLLPSLISGYGFVFSTASDLPKARQLRNEVHTVPPWTIGYDASDPLSRVLAERIALNAKDAGLILRPTTSAEADLRLAQILLASSDPWVALTELLARIGLPPLNSKGGTVQDLFAQEQSSLASERVIPLFHLPVAYASSPTLKNFEVHMDGTWGLEHTWVETSRP